MRRDDDLVDLLRRKHVLDRRERLVVEDSTVGGDARCAQSLEGAVESASSRGAARVAVHHVALPGLRHRRDDRDADRPALGAAPDGVDELRADERLVGHDED